MSIDRLLDGPGVALAAAVRSRDVTATAVTEAALARIAARDPALGAFTDITAARARAAAARIDATITAGGDPGPLAGVPFAVKNLFDIAGVVTRAGSKINRENPPAGADATAVARLEAAGAVLLGALNMGEYAYDFTGENAHDGPSRNPHDPTRMSGGSSGGSGTAAAAGMAAITLGSDTNGSIRVPAAFCGLFGLKPTYGRLSRAGTYPFVAAFDHIGPLARSVADLAAAYDAMVGPDPHDPVCTRRPSEPVAGSLESGIAGLRIARLGGWFAQSGLPQAFAAFDHVAGALGASATIELPKAHVARASAFLITMTESATLHLPRLRTRAADFDPETRDRLIAGTMVPGAWIIQAQRFRRWFQAEVAEVFTKWDVLLAPTTPMPAPPLGQKMITLGGQEMLVRPNIGLYTQPLSFVGLPVVSVPVWLPGEALPMGVQVVGPPWAEARVLAVARHLERTGVCRSGVASS